MSATAAQRVAHCALAWLCANRDGFTLPDDVLDPRTDVNRTLKPLGELAQLCACVARRSTSARHRVTAEELLRFAWRETRGGGLLLDLLHGEPFATYPMEIYAAFAGAGLRHRGVEDFSATMARTRGWRVTEQEPNRRLGVLNSEDRIGLTPHDAPHSTLRRTWLGGLPEPWTFERAPGYAVTHTVFHLTDWGNAPQRVPHDVADYLTTWLPAWLDSCLEDEQWDLGCELLAVAACLPQAPQARAAQDAWSRVAGGQDPTGELPEAGPGIAARPVDRSFHGCYHSTLVAAFAATLTDARLAGAAAGEPGVLLSERDCP